MPGHRVSEHGPEVVRAFCDVYDVYMVRKQLYISDEHERALKARARELGVSEAELVRRMLDGLLLEGGAGWPDPVPRKPWRGSWRMPTGWPSPTASPRATGSTGRTSTRTAYEVP